MVKLARAIPAVLVAAIGAVTPLSAMAQENCGAALNYEDADIRAVVDEIAIRTGRTFLLDPAVQGRVTVKSPPNGRLCADEAWELFQAVLRVNDFAATPAGDGKYRIVPLQEAARAAGPVGEGRGSDLTTQIIRLNYVDAREAAANLAQIIGNNGVVSPVRTGNSIIVVDTADNVARITEVLKKLDQDTTIYRTIPLQHSSAVELSRLVSELASEMNEESGARGAFSVVPVEASNSLLIRAEPSLMRRLELVVSELDQFGGATSNLSVVYLKHADAEEMAPLLTEVVNSTSGSGIDGAPGRTRASVSYHKPTNSLIINGDAEIQRTLQNVITQLDVRRAQVLVEAIIVDVSDTTVRDLGLQYFLTGTEGSRVPFSTTNFSSAQPNILAAAGAALLESDVVGGDLSDQKSALTEAAVNSLLGFNGFALGGAGKLGDNSFFGAILTAIQDDSFSNVLSTPSIMTLDNETARLQVGQEIPVTTGEAVGDNLTNAFRTVSRQEVGVILEVTPQVNEGGTVTLKIVQEISSVAGPILSTSTDLITNKREISTTALVDDGDILVIGGLIDDTREDKESKVPYLGDIPAVGNLFKSTSRERRRQNLMVFIRPSIIRDQSSANLATGRKMDYMRARELLRDGTPISGMEKLIDEVTGTKAPQ